MRDLICGTSELPGCDMNASPVFDAAFAKNPSRRLALVWPSNVPCRRSATNRKSLVLWLKRPMIQDLLCAETASHCRNA